MTQDNTPAVVEFGPASGPPAQPVAGRPAISRLLTGVRLDNRAVPALAGLGAVAVFVSLISPWQLATLDPAYADRFGLPQEVSAGLTDLGSWGTGYLLAGFALAGCVALILFGAPEVRRHARLAGLGVGGALFAMVVALAVELSQRSVLFSVYYENGQGAALSYRTGLYLAFVGVAALTVSLYLAGRLPAPATATASQPSSARAAASAAAPVAAGAGNDEAQAGSLWRWRRNRRAEADQDEPPPPPDLTVSPAAPFVRPVSGPGVRPVSGPGVRPVSGAGW